MTGIEVAALSLGLGAVTSGLSFVEANQQNKAAKEAAAAERATQDAAARQRQEITARRLQELEGSIRASTAGRGVAGSAVETSLLSSATSAGLRESEAIEINRFFGNLSATSRTGFTSPLGGAVGGFGQGLSIGQGIGGLKQGNNFGRG